MNADGSGSSVLYTHPEESALAPAWSPHGTQIAFALGTFFGGGRADIAVVDADGSNLTVREGSPTWVPGMR